LSSLASIFYSAGFALGAGFFFAISVFSFSTFSLSYVSFLFEPLIILALFLEVDFFFLF
jgi:hypothetical protein